MTVDDLRHPVVATSLAPRRVPEAFVRAEVWAYPLTSETALKDGLLELDPSLETAPTRRLWRECENYLTREASGWSLDRMIAVRDSAWFAPGRSGEKERLPKSVPMHTYLRALAKAHIAARPGETYVSEALNRATHDAFAHYRWLSFSVPEDLLLAALPIDPPPSSMASNAVLLGRRLIDGGVAEIHQHVGAGMDFPMLWAAALGALATVTEERLSDEEILESPGAWRDGRHLVEWLLVAAIARVVLAEYLASGDAAASGQGLWQFLAARCGRPDRRGGRTCSIQHVALLRALHALYPHWRAETPELSELQSLYCELHPQGRELADHPPSSIEQVWTNCDPIAIRMGLCNPNGGERWLMRHGLSHLEELERRRQPDPLFAALFWGTVRLRCQYFRYIVQRPLTAGLQWFIRFSRRIGNLRAPLNQVLPEASFWVAGRNEPVAALEIRTTGSDSSMDLARKLHGFLTSWTHVLEKVGEAQTPEFGIVLHFAKQRDRARRWEKGNPCGFAETTCAQPRGVARFANRPQAAWSRYGHYAAEQQRFVTALNEVLRAKPLLLWLIRGIDVCNDELGVPTWVIASIFDEVRRAAWDASAARPERPFPSQARGPAHAGIGRIVGKTRSVPPPLRITAHAGEDFRHPLAGLRRIFEAVRYLMGQEPGRIGHATALGLDPRSWAETTGAVMVPLEDRLWDLAFEWRLYAAEDVYPDFRAQAPAGRMPWVEQSIIGLAEEMFKGHERRVHLTPRLIARAYHRAHQIRLGQITGDWNPRRGDEGNDEAWLLDQYMHDLGTFRRGQQLIEVGTDPLELEALTQVQNALRQGIAARGVVIEVNPSSNLLIGDMLDLRHHPILRLRPIEPSADAPPAVPIAIGSDNPVTFCTSLVGEYALLEEAARAAGYPQPVVQDWLEGIRRTGMDARFTVRWLPSGMSMAQDLLRALEDYLLCPSRYRRDGRS